MQLFIGSLLRSLISLGAYILEAGEVFAFIKRISQINKLCLDSVGMGTQQMLC